MALILFFFFFLITHLVNTLYPFFFTFSFICYFIHVFLHAHSLLPLYSSLLVLLISFILATSYQCFYSSLSSLPLILSFISSITALRICYFSSTMTVSYFLPFICVLIHVFSLRQLFFPFSHTCFLMSSIALSLCPFSSSLTFSSHFLPR